MIPEEWRLANLENWRERQDILISQSFDRLTRLEETQKGLSQWREEFMESDQRREDRHGRLMLFVVAEIILIVVAIIGAWRH